MTLPPEESLSDEELLEVARGRAKARRDLSAQVVLFALVNAFLWLAWALTAGPEFSLAASPIWVTSAGAPSSRSTPGRYATRR